MGNCLKKGEAIEDSDNPLESADVATSDFSGGVDALFADLGASFVTSIKRGPLKKYSSGGIGNKWQTRTFELTNTTLSWSERKDAQTLTNAEIQSAVASADVDGKPAFSVQTNVKKGKSYLLISPTAEKRDEWVEGVQKMLVGSLDAPIKGKLLKLGGKKKTTWEERSFTLSATGMEWDAKKGGGGETVLSSKEIASVRQSEVDPAVGPVDFQLQTSIKGGKVYYLRATTVSGCKEWMAAIQSVVGEAQVVFNQMGDNGGESDEPAEPEPSEEDLAEELRLKEEKRVRQEHPSYDSPSS
jgi:hypothetical protein